MKVVKEQLSQVSPQLYKKLLSLNLRDEGEMQDRLRYERWKKEGVVHYILDGAKLIGWSLLFTGTKRIHCHLYIRRSERRKGYGRQLFQANTKYTKQQRKTFKVTTSKDNREFFRKVKRISKRLGS